MVSVQKPPLRLQPVVTFAASSFVLSSRFVCHSRSLLVQRLITPDAEKIKPNLSLRTKKSPPRPKPGGRGRDRGLFRCPTQEFAIKASTRTSAPRLSSCFPPAPRHLCRKDHFSAQP